MTDYSLFPNSEEWGTGDEAMDGNLSIAIKKVQSNLTIQNISEFYFYGKGLKPRAYNPTFQTTIELVTKAFFFCLFPDDYNDHLMKKVKGNYFVKDKIKFELSEKSFILNELKNNKVYRYNGQIDFYLHHQDKEERNPFVRQLLKRSAKDLHAKIIMKDFKNFLSGENVKATFDNPLFQALREGSHVLLIENFAEIWYHQDQIFSLPTFELEG